MPGMAIRAKERSAMVVIMFWGVVDVFISGYNTGR